MRLCVVLLTYDRLEYAKKTLEAFYQHVTPKPHLHIADDGSGVNYQTALINFARAIGAPGISLSDSARGGYGRNVNLASQMTHQMADAVFMLEDDWELMRPLDLTELAGDLFSMPEVGCIRMGYLSFTQPMWGHLRHGASDRKYLLLDSNSPEPHVFAGHPRLERVAYQQAVGAWPEGLPPGETEFAVAHNRNARCGVAWPIGIDARQGYGMFAHIGSVRSW